jgi:glycosyltransferase involved in cell wall biosynthesis
MIVRDEAPIIERCLASTVDLADRYVIVDTGSKDDTIEVIERWGWGKMPGEIYCRDWVNFAWNRTELAELAQGKADWLLLLDADDTVVHQGAWPDLDADCYAVRTIGNPEVWLPRLVRGDRAWRWIGAAHEYMAGGEDAPRLHAIALRNFADGAGAATRHQRNLTLLLEDHGRHPDNPRTVFYLANTYRDLGQRDAAIDLYRQRAKLGGWAEETYEAMFQAALLDDSIGGLFDAWLYRPQRAEPLYEMAWRLRAQRQWAPAYMLASQGASMPVPDDRLFVRRWVYDWGCRFEASIAAYYTGRADRSLELCDELLASPDLPDNYRRQVEKNREWVDPDWVAVA